MRSEAWLRRFDWMDRAGQRWWPIFGAVYFLVAIKRVHGMRLLSPAWKNVAGRKTVPVSMANRAGDNRDLDQPWPVKHMNRKTD